MLPPDPLARLARSYHAAAARWRSAPRAAEVREDLARTARTVAAASEAVGDLRRDALILLDLSAADAGALLDRLDDLARRAHAAAADLKRRAGVGGRRRLPGAYGLPPRAELLLAVRALLGTDATNGEVLDAAAEVLAECGEDETGLADVLKRLVRKQEKSKPVAPVCAAKGDAMKAA